jgi:hypothetical protein
MMSGKAVGILLVALGLIAGGAMYWLQVYAFYHEVRLASDGGDVTIRATRADGTIEDIPVVDFHGIDAESSPIRFRACFVTSAAQNGLALYPSAQPLVAPGWFDCFDAAAIGADLEAGRAVAVLGEENVLYGIDRVLALYSDGRAYAWHQINACGEVVFDGEPPPEGCPPVPEEAGR